MDRRKQPISIRMSAADLRNVKRLAKRLGVNDSDVVRFAIKMMLSRLAPLYDMQICGKRLVPVFVESGTDIFRYLELDAIRLEAIINEGADETSRVDHEDVQLIAMTGIQQSYAKLRLSSLGNGKAPAARLAATGEQEELGSSLRRYLYDKYVYRNDEQRSSLTLESYHEG
jgi:hypothetical protein